MDLEESGMDALEVMKARHSVRQYTDRPIEAAKRAELDALAAQINQETGLHIQAIYDEPACFDSLMARYGKFSGVNNYIALVGKRSAGLDELAGYHGERLVLKAQELGLNTCWVGMTHGKSQAVVDRGEKLACLISLGYGETQGVPRKSKSASEVCNCADGAPEWFARGIEAALLAPTAMNQQKFFFELREDGSVKATCGRAFYSKMDLGIVKCHFEECTGRKVL